jgi:hypothetical protein
MSPIVDEPGVHIDTHDWRHLGSTSNAEFYELAADIIVIVPHPNCTDDEGTARESVGFQDRHWRKVGHRGGVICFMDPILSQDSGARAVYATETQRPFTTCYALVGATFFGHAVSSVFTGLAKPPIPTQIFRTWQEARPWIEQMNQERGGPL